MLCDRLIYSVQKQNISSTVITHFFDKLIMVGNWLDYRLFNVNSPLFLWFLYGIFKECCNRWSGRCGGDVSPWYKLPTIIRTSSLVSYLVRLKCGSYQPGRWHFFGEIVCRENCLSFTSFVYLIFNKGSLIHLFLQFGFIEKMFRVIHIFYRNLSFHNILFFLILEIQKLRIFIIHSLTILQRWP